MTEPRHLWIVALGVIFVLGASGCAAPRGPGGRAARSRPVATLVAPAAPPVRPTPAARATATAIDGQARSPSPVSSPDGAAAAVPSAPTAMPDIAAGGRLPPPSVPAGVPADAVPAIVARVVDGDTIDVVLRGAVARVRLILVDTPEIFGKVACYGDAAARFARATVPPGTPVFLERDVSDVDRYGRLLRYVYVLDGSMLNELIALGGYGRLAVYPPDVRYRARIAADETRARAARAGLWGACASASDAAPASGTPATGGTPSGGACAPSYPDVCIPPPPPDLDCADIPYRGFRVVGDDPHGLDANHDGIGCVEG